MMAHYHRGINIADAIAPDWSCFIYSTWLKSSIYWAQGRSTYRSGMLSRDNSQILTICWGNTGSWICPRQGQAAGNSGDSLDRALQV